MFLVNRPSLWVLLLAFGGQTAAAQQPAFPIELSAPEKAALAELDQSRAATYPLIDSWFEGRPIQYYHFGPSAVQPSSLYRIGGGGEVVSNLPGLPGYSALLQVFDVEISPNSGIAAADVKSRDMVLGLLQTGRARLKATGLILNLPIVPDGSSLERDPESRPLKAAFYKGETVHYFDFGPTRAAAIPLLAFASGFDEGGQPEPVEGQASNASGIPGVRGYSDLWAVDAAIGGEYQPGAYRDYRRAIVDARAGRLRLTSRGVQNCPVVYVEGRPAPRPRSPLEARGNAGAVMAAAAPSDGAVRPAGAGPVVPAAATAAPAAAGIVNPAATPVGAANSYAGFAGQIAVRAPRQDAQVAVDGVLDERAWANAARLRQFSQYQPVDGRPAEDSAEVLVWYSSTTIYFGIRAYEPHGAVHATLANRDRIGGDDFVQILLDTFNDRRRALMFGVNPLGIQSDGILSEGGTGRGGGGGGLGTISTGRDTADLSADFVFQSKGRVTDWGYEVEVGIPFKTLRYQPADVQNWGINIVRKVQHSGYENTWTPARQANPSFLGQAGRLEGLTGISRGLVLDVNPELTGKAAGAAGA
ncbi:MAG: carbohydrate binding family 9 domain-containing protein, partial [Gemmatimonadetes bacterium]|nr:carbohydrate binding family 9 domain-containing protein [Gemmatimonadota bacterium]